MARIEQIRGMLLEEALLHLLRGSGYRTVEATNNDNTLQSGPSGLMVKGRGGVHQIDAIADFIVHQPFSHPQRLLVEAKCYSRKVSLPVIRNAVGVLKDVSEYWIPEQLNVPAIKRYHYQYALFSASSYTRAAEKYAFAQDIYLIPLAKSQFFRPIINAINGILAEDFHISSNKKVIVDMSRLRQLVRRRLKNFTSELEVIPESNSSFNAKIDMFIEKCRQINYAVIAILRGSFPVFLVPSPHINFYQLSSSITVRIFWDADGWYLRDSEDKQLFSFDLPPELFLLYAEGGVLSRGRALDLKEEALSEFQAIITQESQVKVITFRLDHKWLDYIREKLQPNVYDSNNES